VGLVAAISRDRDPLVQPATKRILNSIANSWRDLAHILQTFWRVVEMSSRQIRERSASMNGSLTKQTDDRCSASKNV
jgi:hypothetical protein